MLTKSTSNVRRTTYSWRLYVILWLIGSVCSSVQAQSSGSITTTQSFSYTGQIVTFTVPAGVTSLTIEARGAQGGSAPYVKTVAGRGAILRGTFSVSSGQSLSLLVGGQGRAAGGGGGSFVVSGTNPAQPLLIAGGGGGAASSDFNGESGYDSPTKDGQAGPDGGEGAGPGNSGGQGGTSGGGGIGGGASSGAYANAGGGGGFRTDGIPAGRGGKAFVNGGNGGNGGSAGSFVAGGFGGGGAGSDNPSSGDLYGGGGGGGFSGGGGGSVIIYQGTGVGGGGGSFNAGAQPYSATGQINGNTGNGLILISYVPPCNPFTVSLGKDGDLTCVKKSVTLTTTGGPTGAGYTYSSGAQASSASSATATVTSAGPYSVTVTVPGGCSATATTIVSSNTLSPSVRINPISQTVCQGQQAQFSASGADTYSWSTGATTASISASVTGSYSVTGTSSSNGCQGSASASLTVNPLPDAPSLMTQSGYPYPAGVSSLTLSQNVGPVSLTATGCSGGMIMANGSVASSFTISTANTGTQTYTATCTQNGCTGPAGSFQLTVLPTTLSVLHRDQDYGATQNNIIKPYLELANAGGSAIPYSDITVRYWFTSEGQAPPTNLSVYYAQLGAVNMNYVALSQPRQGASGYVEYSFPGGGTLGGGANSGPIENGIQKTDGSNFNENDDYSYAANYQDYVLNPHITAYRNGTIFYGQEPTVVSSQTAVQVYTQAKDGTTTSQIQTRVELRNTGNVALAIQDFRIRYYFTSDNNQPANVYVDYADIGASNIQARVIKLPAPVGGADSYVELRTVPTSMSLAAQSSLGAIDFRLVRSDNGLFDQSNDYSFMPNYGNVGLNNRVTVLLNNRLIFGTPPSGAPARVVAIEPGSVLQARLLGNPVMGNHAEVEVNGVAGQAVSLHLVDLQGRAIHEQRIEQAGEQERVSLPLGQSRGMLLLKVSTTDQQQQLKLIRP